jgi:hypothetical protein
MADTVSYKSFSTAPSSLPDLQVRRDHYIDALSDQIHPQARNALAPERQLQIQQLENKYLLRQQLYQQSVRAGFSAGNSFGDPRDPRAYSRQINGNMNQSKHLVYGN